MSVFPAGTLAATRREPSAGADPIDRLAAVAETLVRTSAPASFAVARTDDAVAAILRLRHRVVIERRWARPEELPDGIERDRWDGGALHIGGFLTGELVACARLVLPRPGHTLPVEEVFDLTVAPAGKVVQVDRLVVARCVTDPGHRILLGLTAFCWLEAHAHGCHVWTGIDSRLTTRLYRSIGFEVELLGPGRHYWSEERFPVRFDTIAAADAIAAVWDRALDTPVPVFRHHSD